MRAEVTDLIDDGREAAGTPWVTQQFARFGFLRRIPARLIGIGLRPEDVRTAEVLKK